MSRDLLLVGVFSPTEFCYVLRSCSKRMVDNLECTLGKNNFLVLLYLDISDKEKGFDFFFRNVFIAGH